MDELLKLFGVKDLSYDQLTPPERQTFHSWLDGLRKNQLTVADIHKYITQLRDQVEGELTKPNLTPREDIYLKARLRNLLLLDSMLSLPVKAEELLRKQVSSK
jgi:hypothetical protein